MRRSICGETGPQRTLWGRKVNLSCSLPAGHFGDHCDQAITGYSQGNWWPRPIIKERANG